MEIFDHKAFKAKALKTLYSTILNSSPALLYVLPCVKILHFYLLFYMRLAGLEPMTTLYSTSQFCRHLSELVGVFPVHIAPAVLAQKPK